MRVPVCFPFFVSSIVLSLSTCLKITWVQQRQHHRAHKSARERMLSLPLRGGSTPSLSHFRDIHGAASVAPMWFCWVWSLALRQWETHSQCVSLAPPKEPLKLFLLHSIVFHIALWQCETHSQCLACSAERAIEAISLAFHSVSHRLNFRNKWHSAIISTNNL